MCNSCLRRPPGEPGQHARGVQRKVQLRYLELDEHRLAKSCFSQSGCLRAYVLGQQIVNFSLLSQDFDIPNQCPHLDACYSMVSLKPVKEARETSGLSLTLNRKDHTCKHLDIHRALRHSWQKCLLKKCHFTDCVFSDFFLNYFLSYS